MQTSLIIAIAALYITSAAILHALLMYDLRRDLRLFTVPTALMFIVGLAVMSLLWPLTIAIALIAAACTRQKGGNNGNH